MRVQMEGKQDARWLIFGLFLGLVGSLMTGCSGVELGGRLGVYRVDERQESQRTHRQSIPLICYLRSCEPTSEDMPK